MKKEDKVKKEAAVKRIQGKYSAKKSKQLYTGNPNAVITDLLKQIAIKDKAIAHLEAECDRLKAENRNLKATKKEESKKDTNDPAIRFKGYSTDWPYLEKVCFVIEKSKESLTVEGIVELILLLEPGLKKRLLDPYKSITQAVYQGVKLERLIKGRKNGNYGHTYFLNPIFKF